LTEVLTVATYNLYQGAGLIPAYVSETIGEMTEALRDAYGKMRKSDFPGRAAAIAELLAGHRPDVVGLQEVARWECGPDGRCDFLEIMLDQLARVGLAYRAVAVDITSTLALHAGGDPVGVVDRDALLVRADVPADRLTVGPSGQQVFAARVEAPLPSGIVLTKVRGWGWADLSVAGRPLRVVNTHLEAYDGDVRAAQAEELGAALDGSGQPAVVFGDFNATPEDPAYGVFRDRGYVDAWVRSHGSRDGYTGVQPATLDNDVSELYQRIDHVLYRASDLEVRSAALVGADADSRLPSGLWPSDHAGVVAAFGRTDRP
jgi:endonuclease/exonuclease/phosphatase family metal-dependent hydrolase